jgi:Acetyltransferase (GNAT) domain
MLVVKNPDFLALPPAAASLFEDAAKDSFFSSAAWYDLMTKFGVERGQQARLYLDSDVRCQFGLVSKTAATDGVPGNRLLGSLTNAYSCEHRIILAPSVDRALALQQLAECLASESPAWHRIVLAGFDPADPAVAALAFSLRNVGMVVKPYFDSGTWYEVTAGYSFAEYLAHRPSVLRNTWRRKAARLERVGPSQFRYYDSIDEIESGIADYEEVYRNSWKPDENFPLFIPELIRMAARLGALRMATLRLGGRPAAAQFWIVWNGRACIYKLAHDKRFDEYSPGTVLTMRMMEAVLCKDKPVEVNFGRGDDPYKKLWLSKRRERWGLVAANPRTLRGFGDALWQTAARIASPLRPGKPRPPSDWT